MTASTLLDDAAAQWFRTAQDRDVTVTAKKSGQGYIGTNVFLSGIFCSYCYVLGHLLVRSLIPTSNDNHNTNNDFTMARPCYNDDNDVL